MQSEIVHSSEWNTQFFMYIHHIWPLDGFTTHGNSEANVLWTKKSQEKCKNAVTP